jgi:hypothetical protein
VDEWQTWGQTTPPLLRSLYNREIGIADGELTALEIRANELLDPTASGVDGTAAMLPGRRIWQSSTLTIGRSPLRVGPTAPMSGAGFSIAIRRLAGGTRQAKRWRLSWPERAIPRRPDRLSSSICPALTLSRAVVSAAENAIHGPWHRLIAPQRLGCKATSGNPSGSGPASTPLLLLLRFIRPSIEPCSMYAIPAQSG